MKNEPTTVSKLSEHREPHKSILEFLEGVDGEFDPFCSKDCIEVCLDDFDLKRGKSDEERDEINEQIEEALSDLERDGLIISKSDMYVGEKYAHVSFKEQIEAEEDEYEALKSRVYAGAEKHGMWPKWSESDGWRLEGPTGVVCGNMRELEGYLLELDVDEAAKSAA